MKINIINGPNLNLLGKREPQIYGQETFVDFFERLYKLYPQLDLNYFQSNSEGVIIDKLHDFGFSADGIILNAGAYSHTSIAIADAIKAIPSPVVEVHISNVFAREDYRHHSMLSAHCAGVIVGCGLEGYRLAIELFLMRQGS
ncbi:MAG: type II 3-dehydroquinate dehydratase [Saprospiraceae bacterium]|jgi:3-dehydroquinate dehydratase-2|nr:type II 3-dehydroquinate dehydratase [Saprospiraceae bacterium]MDP4819499.1 type II 3-dehydroquinate dehydratase [Saprospiraceae bacterium]MDP4998819.1 type II 3-dehydroquinate dehydratase [Saprospiraceae bacterium]